MRATCSMPASDPDGTEGDRGKIEKKSEKRQRLSGVISQPTTTPISLMSSLSNSLSRRQRKNSAAGLNDFPAFFLDEKIKKIDFIPQATQSYLEF